KSGLKRHIYQVMKEKFANDPKRRAGIDTMVKLWEERMQVEDESLVDAQTRETLIDLLESQRAYLAELNTDPEIDEEIIREHLYQIDLEEVRLRMA
ncbi:MAG: Na+/H+ antiporter, partial [Mucilaginibacter polytrichastri]|nr:Na+/H+ antiporter [Mucilaginibacter polytrichastri]